VRKGEKLIFLDYDGVIFPPRAGIGAVVSPHFNAVNILNGILGRENPGIVVTAGWRDGKTMRQLENELWGWGLTRAKVVGLTPQIKKTSNLILRKAQEISLWFALTCRVPIPHNNFVVVNHWPVNALGLDSRLVKTSGVFEGKDGVRIRELFGRHTLQMEELEKRLKEHEGQLLEGDVQGVGV